LNTPADGAATEVREPQPAGLGRCIAAALYDSFLLLGILFIATGIAVAVNDGEAVTTGGIWFKAYLLAAGFPYFGWCWTRGGQTLGMKSWHIKLQRVDGQAVQLRDAALRYLMATLSWLVFFLGYLWMLFDSKRRSWHDIASATRLVTIPQKT
jgi:uncharacterized RDD family membrane protein YckC